MDQETILVIGRLRTKLLDRLTESTSDAHVVVGGEPEAFAAVADEATVVLSWGATRDQLRQIVHMCPNLRWIHVMSAGLDTVLSAELEESPAVLTNGRGVFSLSLGEWAIGAILYFAKDFRRLIRSQAEGRWDPFDVVEISGQTVGIVGYGDIGRAVAARAGALGMRVLGLNRRGPLPDHPDVLAQEIFAPRDRIRMIEQCDYLVVTAPLTPHTRGLIGEVELAAMKPDSVVINIGRGPVIQEEALLRALSEKRIKGAALDVFDTEPLPDGHPFYSLENVLLSPHSADHTTVWLTNAMEFFLENLQRFRKGESLVNVIEKGRGY
jgi:phosphoglycerate dehydrogenase-like enzyme